MFTEQDSEKAVAKTRKRKLRGDWVTSRKLALLSHQDSFPLFLGAGFNHHRLNQRRVLDKACGCCSCSHKLS
jgi:hypothetical protein